MSRFASIVGMNNDDPLIVVLKRAAEVFAEQQGIENPEVVFIIYNDKGHAAIASDDKPGRRLISVLSIFSERIKRFISEST